MAIFAGSYVDLVNLKIQLFEKLRGELHGVIIADRERERLRMFRQRITHINQQLTQADRRATPRRGSINWATFQPIMG